MTVDEAMLAFKREYYHANRERILANKKKNMARRGDEYRAMRRAYYAKNVERMRELNRTSAARHRVKAKARYLANRDEHLARYRAYREKNREELNKRRRDRRAAERPQVARGRPRMESSPMAGVRQGSLMGSDGCNGAVTCN
jgi:hypothetical protein